MSYTQRLSELAAQYGSDKAQLGYMPLYEEYFRRHNFTPENVQNVLEIGTNKGSSLRMWAEFFPNAQVHGIDITRQYEVASNLDCPRIHTHLLNQGSRSELVAFVQCAVKDIRFDIIVDDGSHDQHDQQVSLGVLFDCLKNSGLYVIEDIITGEDWWDSKTYNRSKVRPTREVIQSFQQTGRLPADFLNAFEIEEAHQYCEYRESDTVIYDTHKTQMAFIGRL